MSLLLSAALSFFLLWGSSPAVARLAAVRGSGSTRRLCSPATRALGFPELRPRGVTEGGPAGGEEQPRGAGLRAEARLSSASFAWRPATARLGWAERARKREGWSCSLVLCQALWGDTPPTLHTHRRTRGLTARLWSHKLDRYRPAFSSRLCAFSYAAPRLCINLGYRI